ncbi:hypothetical protein M1328_02035 [Patescibacteria group bacterium]|nr:hypothetical protein [Patescibacteria group bacterium]
MRKTPYVFIIVLIIVLFFIVGFRLGQSTEKTNKAIDYINNLPTPTVPVSPTPITYQEYKSKKYGIRFTFPSNLEIKEDATKASILFYFKK